MKEYIEMFKLNIMGYSIAQFTFWIYVALINITCYVLMGYDKMNAKKKRSRIRESTFIILSWFGGGLGVLIGMIIFNHKTKKNKFRVGIPIIYVITRILEVLIIRHLMIIN